MKAEQGSDGRSAGCDTVAPLLDAVRKQQRAPEGNAEDFCSGEARWMAVVSGDCEVGNAGTSADCLRISVELRGVERVRSGHFITVRIIGIRVSGASGSSGRGSRVAWPQR